jgi:hypothetical protein
MEDVTWVTFEVSSRQLPGRTEENHEEPQSRQPMFRPRFEPNTSQIGVKTVAAPNSHDVNIFKTVLFTLLYNNFILLPINVQDILLEISQKAAEDGLVCLSCPVDHLFEHNAAPIVLQ